LKNSLKDLYTPHRIIHFFAARNQIGEENKKYEVEARNRIKSEIESTKMRNDFYRYLSWMVQSVPLKKRVDHGYTNIHISTFTKESWNVIESFVYHAVEVFNSSHPLQVTTVEKTLQILDEWWNYDRVEYVWEHEIMKDTL
jgi:hypothetical protein